MNIECRTPRKLQVSPQVLTEIDRVDQESQAGTRAYGIIEYECIADNTSCQNQSTSCNPTSVSIYTHTRGIAVRIYEATEGGSVTSEEE